NNDLHQNVNKQEITFDMSSLEFQDTNNIDFENLFHSAKELL
ncbi:28751_t:CDS:1, partial [Racocetra persica]